MYSPVSYSQVATLCQPARRCCTLNLNANTSELEMQSLNRKHALILITCSALASLATMACGPSQPANNDQRASNANVAQSNTAQSSTAQSNASGAKPSSQPIKNDKGSIDVSSVPPGAKVLLVPSDAAGAGEPQSRGLTPTTVAGLAPGKYTVDLEKPGYRFFQKEVTVKSGATVRVNATLRKQ